MTPGSQREGTRGLARAAPLPPRPRRQTGQSGSLTAQRFTNPSLRHLRAPPLCVTRHQREPLLDVRAATAQHGAAQLRLPFPPCWARGVYGASAAAAAPATAAGCCLYGEEEEEKRELSDTSTQIKDKVFYETESSIKYNILMLGS
ncbi:hypothetical protein HJG60_008657 [Phyllostomus discolor]|uniref:Uncharacterized protein n=1 Tax=Phyllostomus discolor TaxID=89673 RepID=A0A833Z3U9_9CHIR|nr:hypothetical protein HJG60_008657 [Phyllostomus discolor]